MTSARVRIRLADSRDVERLQPLWDQGPWAASLPPLAGVVRDELTHVHYALRADADEVVGVAALCWVADDAAEDMTTIVAPSDRRRGIGTQLRLAQVRDLVEMGIPTLYVPCPLDRAAEAWCRTYATLLAALPEETYYVCGTAEALQALATRVPPPHPLTEETRVKLHRRAAQAREALARQRAWGVRVFRRMLARQGG